MTTEETTPVASGEPAPVDPVDAKLIEHGADVNVIAKIKEDFGVTKVEDLGALTEADLIEAGMKRIPARNLLAALKPAVSAPADAAAMARISFEGVLPPVPDDTSWLAALKVGGVLKFNRETVIGTVSAALANRVGLYDLPEKIVIAMERNAESLEEPASPEFWDMQRTLTERSYAEIFAAMPGPTGRFATKSRKTALLAKMDTNLWPSLISFQELLVGWIDSWQKGMANPATMMAVFASMAGGAGGLSSGMMPPPPTDGLRDAAEAVITSINGIFAGTGIPVAMALAYDAQQIRRALENPSLPAQVGALNRDQMLKQLGVAVSSDYPRLEQSLKGYTLGVIELPNVSVGQTELTYITALWQLGVAIPWSHLDGGGVRRNGGRDLTGIGGKAKTSL